MKGRIISPGKTEGVAIVSPEPIGFYGGIDIKTGVVIEKGHPLEGKSVTGKILVFPSGKGSTVGSYVIYGLKKNGAAPSGIINKETETIGYDFCFPIKSRNSFPDAEGINFKYASEIKGLKAIFNGNYKLTDNAWYEMIDHAKTKGYELEGFPLEIFRNDPHSGGNEIEWEAEIYWAVKNASN